MNNVFLADSEWKMGEAWEDHVCGSIRKHKVLICEWCGTFEWTWYHWLGWSCLLLLSINQPKALFAVYTWSVYSCETLSPQNMGNRKENNPSRQQCSWWCVQSLHSYLNQFVFFNALQWFICLDSSEGVAIIALLKRTLHRDCVVMVKQFRPPMGCNTLEFPAGLMMTYHIIAQPVLWKKKNINAFII